MFYAYYVKSRRFGSDYLFIYSNLSFTKKTETLKFFIIVLLIEYVGIIVLV